MNGLGDEVEQVLTSLGIKHLVTRWLGKSCKACEERKQKLNRLTWWCKRHLEVGIDNAKARLLKMIDES